MSGTEIGIAMGATSIVTASLAKLKCYYKMNSEYPCGCGFTDTQIADNDDVHINHTNVNGVDLLYVGKKRSTNDEQHAVEHIRPHNEQHETNSNQGGCFYN